MKTFTLIRLNKFFTGLFVLFAAVSITACSSSRSDEYDNNLYHDNEDGAKTYVFVEDGVEWEVKFEDDKITELYRDNKRIPDNQIAEHEDFINEKIARFEEDMKEMHADMKDFHFDMENFNRDMAEMNEELSNMNFNFNFNSDKFRRQMQKAASDVRVSFDSEEFQEAMNELQEELSNIRVDINMDEIHEEIQKAAQEINEIDFDELRAEMKEMKHEIKKSIKNSKSMKKYQVFMEDLRHELETDGIVEDADDDFDMKFNSREMIIDGKTVPDELHQKYLDMYEEYFHRKMDDDTSIRSDWY